MTVAVPEVRRVLKSGGSQREIVFLLVDGFRYSHAGQDAVALCAAGVTWDGKAQILAVRRASQEDESSWGAFLAAMYPAGFPPGILMITCDGHPALLRALRSLFPAVPVQISVAHRLLTLSRALPPQIRGKCLAEARAIFGAPDRETAVLRFREWQMRWRQQGITAIRALETDLAACLTFYRFPPHLWPKIRTVNLVERLSREARRADDLPETHPAPTADFERTPPMEALPWQMDFRALVAKLTGERSAPAGVFPRSTTPPQVQDPQEPAAPEQSGGPQVMDDPGLSETGGEAVSAEEPAIEDSDVEVRAAEIRAEETRASEASIMEAPPTDALTVEDSTMEDSTMEDPAADGPRHSTPHSSPAPPSYMEETWPAQEASDDAPPAPTSEPLTHSEPASMEWREPQFHSDEETPTRSLPRGSHAGTVVAATALAGLAAGILASLLR